jgi:hypothetical protein
MNSSRKTNLERNGDRGEDFVAQLLNAIRSMNKYDSEKDMTTGDGTEVEVKTQVPWYAENAFTLDLAKKTNFNKCMKVDRLIFVEIPRNDVIKVYECVDRRGGWTSTTSKGRRMYCLPISEMNLIHSEVNTELAKFLRADSNSKFIKSDLLLSRTV